MANSQTFTLNIKAVADMKDVVSNIQGIQNALGKLKLPDNLKNSFKNNFKDLEKELDKYQRLMSGDIKTKGDANALTKSGNNILRLYDDVVKKINSIDDSTLKKAFSDLGAKEVENLRNQLTGLESDLKSKLNNQKFINFDNAKTQLKQFKTELNNLSGDAASAFKTLSNSTFNTFLKNLDTGRLDLAAQNLAKIKQQADQIGNTNLSAWVNDLTNKFKQLQNDNGIRNTTQQIIQLKQQLASSEANIITKLITQFHNGTISAENFQSELNQIINTTNQWGQAQAQANKELDQVKSRIQYFFGLNNVINLVKRAIRGAYETIKELDKAMTETAVVTDFTVGDMWKQLPEYTKRANELGVTTKAAYEAATLYYQQGLNSEEVNALSVETLKMARIAGLDAAEATDRMTNALRGFNMELNSMNAQRVDDVYSKLAAISASNVDEISTAMTKVASLAHNAGMEFETTAAFLAQIIETTRESAETAGTALKTVVARFAEVKKLVGENELKGQDEEGELIDVNKVSAALRTAGIDLNRYFLGEVGIDDIFMELAQKWDSLTSLQQRYIATQAAGSRQQSRFIALMSDYARTQELVGAAYNANGAAAEQFAKTQESLESKLARLKNAWDQFLMGLTNNSVVKIGVDLLTTLLNIVNKLTSAFGEGVGSIMKWTLAIAALRGIGAFISKGGGLEQIIGSLTGGKGIVAGGIGKGLNLGIKTLGKTAWGRLKNLGAYIRGGGWLFGSAGGVGAGGAALSGWAGTVAGLTGIATALTTIGVAAGVTYIAVKKVYDLTPEGQLKAAQKLLEKRTEEAKQAQEISQNYSQLQEQYDNLTKSIEETTNVEEAHNLIQSRNEAIMAAMKENATLGQYVNITREGTEIVLTLKEETFTNAVTKAAEEATKAVIAQYQQEAITNYKQAQVYTRELDRIYTRNFNNHFDLDNLTAEQAIEKLLQGNLSDKDFSRVLELANLIPSALESGRLKAEQAYAEIFKDAKIDADLSNQLTTALGTIFKDSGEQFGEELILGLVGAVSKDNNLQLVAKALTGDFGGADLSDLTDEQLDNLIPTDAIERFAKLLGEDSKAITKNIRARQQDERAAQQRIKNSLKERGITDQQLAGRTSEYRAATLPILESAEENLNEAQIAKLRNELYNGEALDDTQLKEILNFYNSLNLNEPISSFQTLKEAAKSTNEYIRDAAEDILQSNKQIFNKGNLLQSFLISNDYDKISEDLQNLIETNGALGAIDVETLAKKCSSLDILLKQAGISANGLAKALTLVGNGSISIEALNSRIINVLENTYNFRDLVDDVSKTISDFDEGKDYGEGIDFLNTKVKDLQELVNNFEFGNQRTKSLYELIFGEGSYKNATEDQIRRNVELAAQLFDNDAYGFFSNPEIAGQLGIQDLGNQFLQWDLKDIDNYQQLIDKVKNAGSSMGFELSDAAAKMLIEAFAAHGNKEFGEKIQDLDKKSFLENIYGGILENAVLSESEVEALAAQAGMDPAELVNALVTAYGNQIKFLGKYAPKGQILTSGDLFNWFKQSLGLNENNIDSVLNGLLNEVIKEDGTKEVTLDLANLKLTLGNMGITDPAQQAMIAEQLDQYLSENYEGYKQDEELELSNLALKVAGITNVTFDEAAQLVEKIQAEAQRIVNESGESVSVTLSDIEASVDLTKGLNLVGTDGVKLSDEQIRQLQAQIAADLALGDISAAIDKITVNIDPKDTESRNTLIANIKDYIGTIPLDEIPAKLGKLNLSDLTEEEAKAIYVEAQKKVDAWNTENSGVNPLILTPKGIIQLDDVTLDPDDINKIQTLIDIQSGIYGEDLVIDGTKVYINGQLRTDFAGTDISSEDLLGLQNNTLDLELVINKLGIDEQVITNVWDKVQGYFNNHEISVKTIVPEHISNQLAGIGIEDQEKQFRATLSAVSVETRAGKNYDELPNGFKDFINNLVENADILKEQYNSDQEVISAIDAIVTAYKNAVEAQEKVTESSDANKESLSSASEAAANLEDGANQAADGEKALAGTSGETSGDLTQLGNAAGEAASNLSNIGAPTGGGGGGGGRGPLKATQASGGYITSPEDSLLGEEGAEVVWNKEQGYSYIAGQNGPEFQNLQSGDRVFNADETRKILQNSKHNLLGSFAAGGQWGSGDSNNKNGGGGSGSGDGGSEKETEWKNEIDWLYNLVEDIAELEREQTKLQELYEDYLKDESKHGKDLYDLLVKQLGNLYTQLNHQQAALELREREMREFMDTTNEYDEYLWYNWEDRTLEVDWDAIEALQDKDTYDKIKELISEAESIQKKMDDAEDSITDVQNQIQDLENIWRDTYVQFEERVYKAIVSYYQQIIDNYSELNTTLSESNTNILNAIQKQISLERQIRDNTQTEEDIADNEAQLAFLRRDTTGGNQLASLQLQKELDDQRQSYEDTLIDQAISRLQDDNSLAAEQREKQIEIMQAQLDYQEQNGEFNARVTELIESAMGADGELLTNSDLFNLLKEQESWSTMSKLSQEIWEEELNHTFAQVSAQVLQTYAEQNGTFISALTGAIEGMTSVIGSKSQPSIKIDYGGSSGSGGSGGSNGSGSSGGGTLPNTKPETKPQLYDYRGIPIPYSPGNSQIYVSSNRGLILKKYATGGLNTSTGLAWLDGTSSEPEYVLNARQTDAFLRLSEVLPAMMQGGVNTSNTFGGINLNLVMNVDQIASDYDVDRIADRVKDIVYNAGQYRNVNTLNFIR